jgi:hypothetical protein
VGLIRANVEGLSALAGRCEEEAGAVGGTSASPSVAASFQARSSTVTSAHADVAAASTQLTVRLQSTAAEVASAAQGYATTVAAVSAVGTAAV